MLAQGFGARMDVRGYRNYYGLCHSLKPGCQHTRRVTTGFYAYNLDKHIVIPRAELGSCYSELRAR